MLCSFTVEFDGPEVWREIDESGWGVNERSDGSSRRSVRRIVLQMTLILIFHECLQSNTVKNYRNFTDPVMGNCDKKSTGNREFTGKCLYILYINGQFTVLLRIFRKFKVNWPFFTGFTVYSPENLLLGNAPFFQITGHFPAANTLCLSLQNDAQYTILINKP